MGNFLSSGNSNSHIADASHLRRLGDDAFQQRKDFSARSQAAYHAGQHGLAKQLSNEAKSHAARGEQYHADAAKLIFTTNNKHRPSHEVDLHGLRVKEAIQYATDALNRAKKEDKPFLILIVGQGKHSADGMSKLKPAVNNLVEELQLRCTVGKPNPGCLYVEFVKPGGLIGWVGEHCVIC